MRKEKVGHTERNYCQQEVLFQVDPRIMNSGGKATQTTERASHTHHLKERGAKVLIFFPTEWSQKERRLESYFCVILYIIYIVLI